LLVSPKELQEVLDYLRNQVVVRKAVIEVGNREFSSREDIFRDFEDRFGLVIDIFDEEPDSGHKALVPEGMNDRLISLPGGVKFRMG
jgi:hypothetical protein